MEVEYSLYYCTVYYYLFHRLVFTWDMVRDITYRIESYHTYLLSAIGTFA